MVITTNPLLVDQDITIAPLASYDMKMPGLVSDKAISSEVLHDRISSAIFNGERTVYYLYGEYDKLIGYR